MIFFFFFLRTIYTRSRKTDWKRRLASTHPHSISIHLFHTFSKRLSKGHGEAGVFTSVSGCMCRGRFPVPIQIIKVWFRSWRNCAESRFRVSEEV